MLNDAGDALRTSAELIRRLFSDCRSPGSSTLPTASYLVSWYSLAFLVVCIKSLALPPS